MDDGEVPCGMTLSVQNEAKYAGTHSYSCSDEDSCS